MEDIGMVGIRVVLVSYLMMCGGSQLREFSGRRLHDSAFLADGDIDTGFVSGGKGYVQERTVIPPETGADDDVMRKKLWFFDEDLSGEKSAERLSEQCLLRGSFVVFLYKGL